jgi:hypothetical protein
MMRQMKWWRSCFYKCEYDETDFNPFGYSNRSSLFISRGTGKTNFFYAKEETSSSFMDTYIYLPLIMNNREQQRIAAERGGFHESGKMERTVACQ